MVKSEKIALRSIKLKAFVLANAVVLLHLIRSCDVAELTTLVALFLTITTEKVPFIAHSHFY